MSPASANQAGFVQSELALPVSTSISARGTREGSIPLQSLQLMQQELQRQQDIGVLQLAQQQQQRTQGSPPAPGSMITNTSDTAAPVQRALQTSQPSGVGRPTRPVRQGTLSLSTSAGQTGPYHSG